ncbi:type II toxin-antitoxin system YafQ family toxin [Allofranklinella schreckenbergeri]|uniref:Type II toxin-antitoxin system YafQ family toxin n=1 Tax=Allofranklinella schreckenbergeri TaxID=1076744 RepID=A0A3M6QDX0_9BURK|nr:type II toxin-antitoxin system YafQ family toxin [Allofranklinella schreckenbergeri]RMX01085.1 type II toxin-antitoxin system YafQ family toxin [Allofranklinella schreckenbergeri]
MLPIDYTRAFKRDFKKQATLALSRHWIEALYCLCQRQSLPARYRDHALGGDWQGFRDCHIEPDLVLIYRQTEQALELVRIGSHAELFG